MLPMFNEIWAPQHWVLNLNVYINMENFILVLWGYIMFYNNIASMFCMENFVSHPKISIISCGMHFFTSLYYSQTKLMTEYVYLHLLDRSGSYYSVSWQSAGRGFWRMLRPQVRRRLHPIPVPKLVWCRHWQGWTADPTLCNDMNMKSRHEKGVNILCDIIKK